MPLQRVTVLVHPGSACGSADSGIGTREARAAREAIAFCLDSIGPGEILVVIDGFLSDELPHYPVLGDAIEDARKRLPVGAFLRLDGCDSTGPGAGGAMRAAVEALKLDPARHEIVFTGAWVSDNGVGGCVGDALLQVCGRFKTSIDDSAIEDPDAPP